MEFLQKLTSQARSVEVGCYLDILDALFEEDYTRPARGTSPVAAKKKKKIMAVQLCLAAIILHPDHCSSKVSNFDISQDYVYGTMAKRPLFKGKFKLDIDLELLLHTVNFFKFHLKAGGGEGLLCYQYEDLKKDELPQTWLGNIKAGTQVLGSHWKGTYGNLTFKCKWY